MGVLNMARTWVEPAGWLGGGVLITTTHNAALRRILGETTAIVPNRAPRAGRTLGTLTGRYAKSDFSNQSQHWRRRSLFAYAHKERMPSVMKKFAYFTVSRRLLADGVVSRAGIIRSISEAQKVLCICRMPGDESPGVRAMKSTE